MTLNLPLTPELEERLVREAGKRGLSPVDYILCLLDIHLPARPRSADLIAMIQSWIDEGDATEQKETGDYLIRVLDEDRPAYRKLFPPELKGLTW